jgi:hypothetical protein
MKKIVFLGALLLSLSAQAGLIGNWKGKGEFETSQRKGTSDQVQVIFKVEEDKLSIFENWAVKNGDEMENVAKEYYFRIENGTELWIGDKNVGYFTDSMMSYALPTDKVTLEGMAQITDGVLKYYHKTKYPDGVFYNYEAELKQDQ